MSDNQEWTVGKLLSWTADYLQKQGAENPRLDAELLLAEARGCERIMLYTAFAEIVPDEVRARFRELVKGRAAGKPVAYLLGRKEFYSLNFRVSPAVLIPRPETEFLVVAVIDLLKTRAANLPPAKVIDVGTGSGAIAISILKHVPTCEMTATDISPEALEVAKLNAATHQVGDRCQFAAGDLLTMFPAQPMFDVIVSNPPYIGERERPTLTKQVVEHEPEVALFGGPTGVETIWRLLDQAAERLLPRGWLFFEFSPVIEAEIRSRIEADHRWRETKITKDYAGFARMASLQLATNS